MDKSEFISLLIDAYLRRDSAERTFLTREEFFHFLERNRPQLTMVSTAASPENTMTPHRTDHHPAGAVHAFDTNPYGHQAVPVVAALPHDYSQRAGTGIGPANTLSRVAAGELPNGESFAVGMDRSNPEIRQSEELSERNKATGYSPLTARETQILTQIAKGNLNKEIALKLGISEQTIKNHVSSILRKLNASVRTEAVVVAIRRGFISLR
ncbi:MAG: response regulator transcription factor [Chloroflexi bacterium]|nr:response regulator transcription factor [Chloroflexota bacterium]